MQGLGNQTESPLRYFSPEDDVHDFGKHANMMMDLSVLADGAEQTLPAHVPVVIPPADVVLQRRVDYQPGIVRVPPSPASRVPLDSLPHLRQGPGEGALPLVPRPDGRGRQVVGAALDGERQDA